MMNIFTYLSRTYVEGIINLLDNAFEKDIQRNK